MVKRTNAWPLNCMRFVTIRCRAKNNSPTIYESSDLLTVIYSRRWQQFTPFNHTYTIQTNQRTVLPVRNRLLEVDGMFFYLELLVSYG